MAFLGADVSAWQRLATGLPAWRTLVEMTQVALPGRVVAIRRNSVTVKNLKGGGGSYWEKSE